MSLTDIVRPRVVEMGKIKIGGKGKMVTSQKGNQFQLPEKYDHFVITTLSRDDSTGNFRPDEYVMKELADKGFADPKDGHIRQLPIALMSNEIEDVLQAKYVWYVGGRLAATSDGKTLIKHIDTKGTADQDKWSWLNEPEEKPWTEAYLNSTNKAGQKLFKMHATFNCILALKQSRFGGVYRMRTTSTISASQLYGSLATIKQATGGYLRGVPLILSLRPMEVSPEGKKTKVYVTHVELIGEDLLQIQQQVLERAKIEIQRSKELEATLIEYRRILNAPGENESAQEQQDAAEEFAPEAEALEAAAADGVQTDAHGEVIDDPLLAGAVAPTPPKPEPAPVPAAAAPAVVTPKPAEPQPQPSPAVLAPATSAGALAPAAEPVALQPPAVGAEPKKRGRPSKPKPVAETPPAPKPQAPEPWDSATVPVASEVAADPTPAPGGKEATTAADTSSTVASQSANGAANVTEAAQNSAETSEQTHGAHPQEGRALSTEAEIPPAPTGPVTEQTISDFVVNISNQIGAAMRTTHIQKLANVINEAADKWLPEDVKDSLLDKCYERNQYLASEDLRRKQASVAQSQPTGAQLFK